MTARVVVPLLTLGLCIGCGTTKWTDTRRSATEQLLITDAMDRAVSQLDFRALAGKTVFMDDAPVKALSDAQYLVSCMRQHMLASGCIIKQGREEADYIMEIRAGVVGTDRHDLLYGVPAVNIPTLVPVSGFGLPSSIPEIPFVKKTDQRAVAKIAVFAYNRKTGRPVWQSGSVPMESNANAIWVFGAGPFQRGSIYDGMNFAGNKLNIPLIDLNTKSEQNGSVSVADEAYFIEPEKASEIELAQETEEPPEQLAPPPAGPEQQPAAQPVVQAVHGETLPIQDRKNSWLEAEAKESREPQASPRDDEVPTALRPAEQAPSSTLPNAKSAALGNPIPHALRATLAYPPGLFAPDHRPTTIR